jgi:hypothetical protein
VHFSGTAPTSINNFATAALQAGGTVALQGITAAFNAITFPAGIPGNYLIAMSLAGSTSASAFSVASQATAPALLLLTATGARDATGGIASNAATAGNYAFLTLTCSVPTAGGAITLNPSTLVGGNAMDLFIVSLPVTVLTVQQQERAALVKMTARMNRLEQLLASVIEDDENEDEKYFVSDIEDTVGPSSTPPRPPTAFRRRVEIISSSK